TAGLNSHRFAFFERGVPKLHRIRCEKENFNAVLTCVTSASDGDSRPLEWKIGNRISRWKIDIRAEQRVKKLDDPRALNGDSARIRAAIHHLNCICGWHSCRYSRKMTLQPREIFVRARRVYDQQKFLLANPINDEVINDSPALVQQKVVLTRADIELADVICEHGVEPFARVCSVHNQLSHVRDIKDANVVSYRLMFLDDARVFHRLEPPGERNLFRAAPKL